MTAMKKIMNYIERHLSRFLLLAVIVTAGWTLRMATVAKYASYVNDYTSVITGDFYFASDYLFNPEDNAGHYQINSWDGQSYDVSIEIRNFENSLRYNATGTDFFYWVEAHVYRDATCTDLDTGYENFISISYGDKNSDVMATSTNGAVEQKYGYMAGMESFDNTVGTKDVEIRFKTLTALPSNSHRYMKIVAHTVPLAKVADLNINPGVSYSTDRGVYYSTLEAVFDLNVTSATASVTDAVYPTSDYAVCYRLRCNNAEGSGGTVRYKAYYNSTYLEPDIALGNSYLETNSDSPHYNWRYVQISINVGGSEDLYFYKKSMQTQINSENKDDYFGAEAIRSDEVDTNPYSISVSTETTIEGGTIGAITNAAGTAITSAPMGTTVKIQIQPNSGYILRVLRVKDSSGNYLNLTKNGANRYSFEMTNGAVTIAPTFVRKVQITTPQNGTVVSNVEGAAMGETVYLTVTPDPTYVLQSASLLLNGSTDGLTKESETLYSFAMPNSEVIITAQFIPEASATNIG